MRDSTSTGMMEVRQQLQLNPAIQLNIKQHMLPTTAALTTMPLNLMAPIRLSWTLTATLNRIRHHRPSTLTSHYAASTGVSNRKSR